MHVFLSSHKESKLKVLLLALGLMGKLENLIACAEMANTR